VERGVSPLIAEIILIAMVFSIATAVIVVLGGTSMSVRTLDAKLGVDGFEWKSQRLVLYHLQGAVIEEAFVVRNGELEWGSLVVKKSGVEVQPLNARLNGRRAGHLIYEDMSSRPMGENKNSAYYDGENRWVRLTPSGTNLNGELEYALNPPPSGFVAEFQFWVATGSGGNAVWFYAYCENTPTAENAQNTGGYVFAYNENENRLQVYYNGALLASTPITGIDNGSWHEARVVFDGQVIEMYMDNDNARRLRVVDLQAASRKGKVKFGWGARGGSPTKEHRVRNLRVWVAGEQKVDFSPGDILEFELKDPLVIGDAMTITYLPQNKLLYMNDIS
jgi:flagellin-like protein